MIFSFEKEENNSIYVNGLTLNCADYRNPTMYLEISRSHALQQKTIEELIDFFSKIEEEDIITITSDDKLYELYKGRGFILTNVSVNINTEMDPSFEQGMAKNDIIQIFLSYRFHIDGSDKGLVENIEGE